jgi:SAM-dependent methyltransferase
VNFFGVETAKRIASEGKSADLLIANNCLAHVPDLNDFVGGMKEILADGGIVNVEYPHLLNIIEQNHLDTIYQEHYCYHSLYTLEQVFAHHGMRIFDVEEISTHGGSLRIYVSHDNDDSKPVTAAVHEIRQREIDRGLTQLSTFHAFADRVKQTKWNLVEFLINARRDGKRVVGYGAPGKGNTMLNYCGIREDLLDFTVDRNPFKQDSFLVGSRIPVYAPEMIDEFKPDYVLIMPWNLRDEIVEQMKHIREWGGQFVVAIPELEVI